MVLNPASVNQFFTSFRVDTFFPESDIMLNISFMSQSFIPKFVSYRIPPCTFYTSLLILYIFALFQQLCFCTQFFDLYFVSFVDLFNWLFSSLSYLLERYEATRSRQEHLETLRSVLRGRLVVFLREGLQEHILTDVSQRKECNFILSLAYQTCLLINQRVELSSYFNYRIATGKDWNGTSSLCRADQKSWQKNQLMSETSFLLYQQTQSISFLSFWSSSSKMIFCESLTVESTRFFILSQAFSLSQDYLGDRISVSQLDREFISVIIDQFFGKSYIPLALKIFLSILQTNTPQFSPSLRFMHFEHTVWPHCGDILGIRILQSRGSRHYQQLMLSMIIIKNVHE